MLQTLFYIPTTIQGWPILLIGWSVIALAMLAQTWWRHGWTREFSTTFCALALVTFVVQFVLPAIGDERGLPIRGYGVMLLLAVLAGVGLSLHRAQRRGIDLDQMMSLSFWLFIGGIVGARAFYVIEYWPDFQRSTAQDTLSAIANVTQGGLVVYGALIGAGLAGFAFVRRNHMPPLVIGDVAAPGMLLGLAIGRIGCLLNGCCFGGPCELPWAVTFPPGSPPFLRQVELNQLDLHGIGLLAPTTERREGAEKADQPPVVLRVTLGSQAEQAGVQPGDRIVAIQTDDQPRPIETVAEAHDALLKIYGEGTVIRIYMADGQSPRSWTIAGPPQRSMPVHPTQIYSAIDALLLCLFLLAYDPFRRRDGELLALMLTIHAISRFLLEIIRTDEASVFGTGLSISQNISLVLLVVAAGLWWYILRTQPPLAVSRPRAPLSGRG